MTGRIDAFLVAIVIVTTVPAVAQWLNVPTKGIPRTKDGKPDLTAPAPRKAEEQKAVRKNAAAAAPPADK